MAKEHARVVQISGPLMVVIEYDDGSRQQLQLEQEWGGRMRIGWELSVERDAQGKITGFLPILTF